MCITHKFKVFNVEKLMEILQQKLTLEMIQKCCVCILVLIHKNKRGTLIEKK